MQQFVRLMILIVFVGLLSCRNRTKTNSDRAFSDESLFTTQSEYVEILFFHNHDRCSTCTLMEQITGDVVATYFGDQVKDGRVVFRVIDINDKKFGSLVDDYEVVWTSLYINKWEGGTETRNNMTQFAFLYIDSSPDLFRSGIKQEIEELLE